MTDTGAWTTFGERPAYESPWVTVTLADVQAPNGARFEHHVIRLPPVAIALLVNDDEEALMLWRHRFVTGQWGYELLGGLVEPGEDPAQAAAREAREESGWQPLGEPDHLATFEPLPGQVASPVSAYLWRRADHVGDPTDTEEAGRLDWVPLARAPDLMRRGQLLGSGTLVALLAYLSGATTQPRQNHDSTGFRLP
ncbi:NUDIX domain-containing protein [Amycolatopsis sp. PS_44_ISF1]|uniref:NUDIX domain-containing protein n=1 Tax=Amycolatopsis sp. PS_44_ISF1 TaxID=2974917 RepID=UPI0028E05984|nr:NUDIX domain-containing protein [Amycolatopsis sp. PS_44_ISF1]MDT8916247.1 NUDIX domain-containing protein [Amycolatopsis sp. PS_44_ISF1]